MCQLSVIGSQKILAHRCLHYTVLCCTIPCLKWTTSAKLLVSVQYTFRIERSLVDDVVQYVATCREILTIYSKRRWHVATSRIRCRLIIPIPKAYYEKSPRITACASGLLYCARARVGVAIKDTVTTKARFIILARDELAIIHKYPAVTRGDFVWTHRGHFSKSCRLMQDRLYFGHFQDNWGRFLVRGEFVFKNLILKS